MRVSWAVLLLLETVVIAANTVGYAGLRMTLEKSTVGSVYTRIMQAALEGVKTLVLNDVREVIGEGFFSAAMSVKNVRCIGSSYDPNANSTFSILDNRVELSYDGPAFSVTIGLAWDFEIFTLHLLSGKSGQVILTPTKAVINQNIRGKSIETQTTIEWKAEFKLGGVYPFDGIVNWVSRFFTKFYYQPIKTTLSEPISRLTLAAFQDWLLLPIIEGPPKMYLNSTLSWIGETEPDRVTLAFATNVRSEDGSSSRQIARNLYTAPNVLNNRTQICVAATVTVGLAEIESKLKRTNYSVDPKTLGLNGIAKDLVVFLPNIEEICDPRTPLEISCKMDPELVLVPFARNMDLGLFPLQFPVVCSFSINNPKLVLISTSLLIRGDLKRFCTIDNLRLNITAAFLNPKIYTYTASSNYGPIINRELFLALLFELIKVFNNMPITPAGFTIKPQFTPKSLNVVVGNEEACFNYN